MAQLSRMGDQNEVGGKILRGSSTVYVNGIPAGLHISDISPHYPNDYPHSAAKTINGSPTVYVDGLPVLRVGSRNTCGHSIIQGSPNVFCP